MRKAALFWLAFTLGLGCVRDDAPSLSTIEGPRILAVLAEPAEAAPGEMVHYRALLVDQNGPRASAQVRWSLCLTPRALSENTSVSAACAERDEQPLPTRELELDALIPRDACARFGSETSLGQRPLDPDHTGGYYQPLRLSNPGIATTIVRQRILCPLARAPIDVAQRFARTYVPNSAPAVLGLTLRVSDEDVAPDALPAQAQAMLTLALREDARESYPLYSALSGTLSTRSESLSAHWFVTRGQLRYDVGEVHDDLSAHNELVTPEADGELWLWVVVRDDRGGVSVLEQALTVAR